ncbi:MAG: hypothetical protein IV090_15520 [Candidatus Sericytochromatia bacterium]|nr:hypothetical protein [Candidatus Sericytochromatia bacterium]
MATQAEKCPQCGHDTLMTLPGAKRKSCTLCHFIPPTEQDSSVPAPFQGHTVDRSKHKRKKTLNLSSHLVSVFLLLCAYGAYQYVNQEPKELEGMRAMERSYNKVTRLITKEALESPANRANLRKLIKREKAVILHLPVSPCLNNPRIYLSNLYTIFEKGLVHSSYNFGKNRRVIAISSKFVEGAAECIETHAPTQFSSLQIFSDFPEIAQANSDS